MHGLGNNQGNFQLYILSPRVKISQKGLGAILFWLTPLHGVAKSYTIAYYIIDIYSS